MSDTGSLQMVGCLKEDRGVQEAGQAILVPPGMQLRGQMVGVMGGQGPSGASLTPCL
jgi:hypothetical protein